MNIKSLFLLPLLACMAFGVALAQIKLPSLIGDNMILQRDQPVHLWGMAAPGETVSATLNKAKGAAVADAAGKWGIELPAQKAGGPYTITLSASNTVSINNVLFGDVWLCSGQSNMETPVERVMTLFGKEIEAYSNKNIRYVKVPLTYNFQGPQDDVPPCSWVELNPKTAGDFSAVAYFFGKEMYEKTGVPVGLLNSSVGGSPAEAWISEEYLKDFPAMLNDMRICRSETFVADMQRLGSLPGQRWMTVLNEQDKGLTEPLQWMQPEYDDHAWNTTDLFENQWSRRGLYPAAGSFWFRKEVEVADAYAGQAAMLYMGRIVGGDYTYVNGKPVGAISYQYPPRNYKVPAGVLKAGKNVITVRVINQGGLAEFVTQKPYRLVFQDDEALSLEGEWKYQTGACMPPASGGGITFQYKPTGLYNAMISPLKNFAFTGVIWYQGESNTARPAEYFDLMTLLVNNWRAVWRNDLPFLSVQLANFMEPSLLQQHSGWAEVRNVQRLLSQSLPDAGMAVAIDVGEWNDIHPLNKKEVGRRLALQARRVAYKEKIVSDGPAYESHTIEGNRILLSFKEGTNAFLPVEELKGFAIAGSDGVYRLAKAKIEGGKVAVWSDEVPSPRSARYAWANNPDGANLYNTDGLPASPFQTKE
jgi:sialate O-acetylesterase